MSRRDTTSAVVDKVLLFAVTGSALTAGILIPNLLIGLEKPLNIFWKHMDKRQRERELRRVVSYMKSNQLLKGDYKHGLQITQKGRKRLLKVGLANLRVKYQSHWDKQWRLVIYDIPETRKQWRNALTAKLNEIGFYQLQRSAWLHPFPCRKVVEKITSYYKIDEYVSYIKTNHIDNQEDLLKKFQKTYPKTNFK